MKKAILIVLLFGALFGAVNAEIITVQVTATVSYLEDNGSYFDESVFVGSNLSMMYSYDTESTGVIVTQTTMSYMQSAPNYISIGIGNYQFQNSGDFGISIRNDTTDSYQVGTFYLAANNLPQSDLTLSIRDSSGMALSSYDLPLPNFNLSDWNGVAQINILSGRDFQIIAQIDSIVPEPATMSLFMLGCVLLRKRSNKF